MSNTVLITGASSGIGRASVEKFQAEGWNVVATMRNPDKETELQKLNNVIVVRLDVTDLPSIDDAVATALEKFGQLDVLVNNAGYGLAGPLEAVPRENILRQFNTNVIGLIDVTKAVIPHMRKQKSGTIINISSIGGRMTFPYFSLYHGTKFAVEGLTESLTFELAPLGIKAKIVEPGAIATDFGNRSLDFNNDESLAEYQASIQKVLQGFSAGSGNASSPDLVAQVIYGAATDGTDTLRYTAGEDAKQYMAARSQQDDASFMSMVKQRFGL